jgi:hypothetical protein
MEIAATRAELLARSPLYHSYFANEEAAWHEEAIANASAVKWCLNDAHVTVRRICEAWMRRQGPGYRDFRKWTSSSALSRGRDRAGRFILKPLPASHPKARPSVRFLFHEISRYRHRLPTKRINDLRPSRASVLRPFPKQYGLQVSVHTNDHPPAHIHIQMPSGSPERRYTWPELLPMKGDPPLGAAGEKSLKRYIEAHRMLIVEKLRQVYGRALRDV